MHLLNLTQVKKKIAIPNSKFIFIETILDISKYFKYKYKQETINRYNVIYKIKCICRKSFIGQTKRNLATRLKNDNLNSNNRETE